MITDSFPDCLGRPVKVGDVVTYPGRRSSSLWINTGRVVELGTYKPYWNKEEQVKARIEKTHVVRDFDIKWNPKCKNLKVGDVYHTYSWIFVTERTTRVG